MSEWVYPCAPPKMGVGQGRLSVGIIPCAGGETIVQKSILGIISNKLCGILR